MRFGFVNRFRLLKRFAIRRFTGHQWNIKLQIHLPTDKKKNTYILYRSRNGFLGPYQGGSNFGQIGFDSIRISSPSWQEAKWKEKMFPNTALEIHSRFNTLRSLLFIVGSTGKLSVDQ